MIGQSLELGHQHAEKLCARRNGDVERRFHGVGEGERVGNGTVARGAARQLRRLLDGRAGKQRLDALMDVTQALLEPHHRLAVGGEAKVSRLDDAGVNRADRNAVQAFALHRQESVSRLFARLLRVCAEWMFDVPKTEIEPRPHIRCADRLEAIEAFDGTLESDGGRMQRAYRRKFSIGAFDTDDIDVVAGFAHHRHMHGAAVAPQAEQRGMAGRKLGRDRTPGFRRHDRARPWPMAVDAARLGNDIGEGGHRRYPSSFATLSNQATSAGGI